MDLALFSPHLAGDPRVEGAKLSRPADQSMITDVHRPRLLPYAAIIVPRPKAGDVARQNALAADIRERGDVDDRAAALAEHPAATSHAQDLSLHRSARKWRKFHLSLEMGGRGADISSMINAKSLFDSFLGQSGQSGQAPSQGQVRAPAGFMEQAKSALGNISGGSFAGGAATGGILGMVLGGKGVQKMAGGVLGYGGAAALGALAHRAYQNWQQGQSPASAPVATQAETQNLDQRFLPAAIPAADGQPFELALIRAMVGAAKADGHLDATERNRIFERVETFGLDAEAKAFVFDALEQDIPVSTIAAAAQTPEQAAELYLAARMSMDPDQAVERAWLGALSHRLRLDPTLAAHLDRQADAGLQPAA
ncbi:tellurite resistance TerB family protein [Belnapia rosea]|uniref:tellurite resistance TerB family protein n=1 Tax=Belnapia rosea TaxID=938405 RepID=UPI0034E84718